MLQYLHLSLLGLFWGRFWRSWFVCNMFTVSICNLWWGSLTSSNMFKGGFFLLVTNLFDDSWWLSWLLIVLVVEYGSGGRKDGNQGTKSSNKDSWEGSLLGSMGWWRFIFNWFFHKGVQSEAWWSNTCSSVGVWSGSIFTVSTGSEPCDDLVISTLVWEAYWVILLSSGIW